jgi:hypothetical protein
MDCSDKITIEEVNWYTDRPKIVRDPDEKRVKREKGVDLNKSYESLGS